MLFPIVLSVVLCKHECMYWFQNQNEDGEIQLPPEIVSCEPERNRSKPGIVIFWSEVNIYNFNCAQGTAFIFDSCTYIPVKVSKF